MITMHAPHTEYLKNLLENPQTKPLIEKAMSNYPMYVPENKTIYSIIPTREQLNNKILNKYKYREIGFETVGRFIDELEITMNEIMPYYYQLYKSVDIMNGIADPFGNVDIKETFEEETTGKSKGLSSGKSDSKTDTSANSSTSTDMANNSKNVNSKTPQGLLELGTKNIDVIEYADEGQWNEDLSNSKGKTEDKSNTKSESSNSGESSSETEGTTKHTFTKVGNQGVNTYAHDMKELREIFLNIEQQIINDPRITELFYLVF